MDHVAERRELVVGHRLDTPGSLAEQAAEAAAAVSATTPPLAAGGVERSARRARAAREACGTRWYATRWPRGRSSIGRVARKAASSDVRSPRVRPVASRRGRPPARRARPEHLHHGGARPGTTTASPPSHEGVERVRHGAASRGSRSSTPVARSTSARSGTTPCSHWPAAPVPWPRRPRVEEVDHTGDEQRVRTARRTPVGRRY